MVRVNNLRSMAKNTGEFEATLKKITDGVNAKLEAVAEVPDVPESSVYEAMKYSLLAGGKRLRPVLLTAVSNMLGGNFEDALAVGCAVECVHTYSLIHDDLPCMDNDDLRRGKPTCHKVFPENIALLAGDGLLNKAFEILSDVSNFTSIDENTLLKLIGILSSASGTKGMIGGQVIDLMSENEKDVPEELLLRMHRKKTGALFEASALMGAVIGGASENSPEYEAIGNYARMLGLAFQIKDDILDVIGDEKSLGKPIGSDEQEGKTTFVTLFGIEGATEKEREYTKGAIDALEMFGEKAAFLTELTERLTYRNR